jgi:hypothetical protein
MQYIVRALAIFVVLTVAGCGTVRDSIVGEQEGLQDRLNKSTAAEAARIVAGVMQECGAKEPDPFCGWQAQVAVRHMQNGRQFLLAKDYAVSTHAMPFMYGEYHGEDLYNLVIAARSRIFWELKQSAGAFASQQEFLEIYRLWLSNAVYYDKNPGFQPWGWLTAPSRNFEINLLSGVDEQILLKLQARNAVAEIKRLEARFVLPLQQLTSVSRQLCVGEMDARGLAAYYKCRAGVSRKISIILAKAAEALPRLGFTVSELSIGARTNRAAAEEEALAYERLAGIVVQREDLDKQASFILTLGLSALFEPGAARTTVMPQIELLEQFLKTD